MRTRVSRRGYSNYPSGVRRFELIIRRASMNRPIIRNLVIAALLAHPVSALGADQAPDVKGKH